MKISKASKILAVLMVLVLTLGLAACSANKKNPSNDNSDIIPLLAQEPNSLMRRQLFIKSLWRRKTKFLQTILPFGKRFSFRQIRIAP